RHSGPRRRDPTFSATGGPRRRDSTFPATGGGPTTVCGGPMAVRRWSGG
ncbi:hypothetical protein A2U01_0111065, partial [Trifolium medium]|nr:hypothetical protein [Trifolium medium]